MDGVTLLVNKHIMIAMPQTKPNHFYGRKAANIIFVSKSTNMGNVTYNFKNFLNSSDPLVSRSILASLLTTNLPFSALKLQGWVEAFSKSKIWYTSFTASETARVNRASRAKPRSLQEVRRSLIQFWGVRAVHVYVAFFPSLIHMLYL